MKRIDLLVQRTINQKLSSSGLKSAADVVRWLGAVQAQDFNAAKWALALRMSGSPAAAVIEEAFNEGEILRTHVMRPTWHFVAPEDIRWLLELTAPRVNLRAATNYRKFELDAATFKRSNKILRRALQGGKHLTRAELKQVLNRSGIAADDTVRMAHIMLYAELDGVVCSGRRVGKQFTYALLDERAPVAKKLTRDEALAELTRRYFRSHGPATLADFAWWSGLTAADARRGIALLDRDLRTATIGNINYYVQSAFDPARSAAGANLLPVYDEFNVAYKQREATLGPTVTLNGQIIGSWKAATRNKAVMIVVKAARSLTRSERVEIAKASERYATFLGFNSDCLTFAIETCWFQQD